MLIDAPDCNQVERISLGIYRQLSYDIPALKLWYEFPHDYPEYPNTIEERLKWMMKQFQEKTHIQEFGSCDSPAQFKKTDNYRIIQQSPFSFIVLLHQITKEDSPGYRWHKNGAYLGKKKPRAECLGDEPRIKSIWQFQTYRKPGNAP